jgi:hypothetical protein
MKVGVAESALIGPLALNGLMSWLRGMCAPRAVGRMAVVRLSDILSELAARKELEPVEVSPLWL